MPRKILLADDSVTAQNMGRRILSEAGYEVVTVNNGSAALKKLAELQPDVVILDIYMPGYGGLEVCQRIKEDGETSSIPVLLTVGKLEPFKAEEARRVRADAHLIKPFEATELLAALTKLEDRIVPRPLAAPAGKAGKSKVDTPVVKDKKSGEPDSSWKKRLKIPPRDAKPEPAKAKGAGTATFREFPHPEEKEAVVIPPPQVSGPPGIDQVITAEEIAAIAAAAAAFGNNAGIPESQHSPIAVTEEEIAAAVSSSPVSPEVAPEAVAEPVPGTQPSPEVELRTEPVAPAPAPVEVTGIELYLATLAQREVADPVSAEVRPQAVAESEPAPQIAEITHPEPAVQQEPVAETIAASAPEVVAESLAAPEPVPDAELDAALAALAPVNGNGVFGGDLQHEEAFAAKHASEQLAAGSGWHSFAAGHAQWMAQEVPVPADEASVILEEEMQKAYAALAEVQASVASFAEHANPDSGYAPAESMPERVTVAAEANGAEAMASSAVENTTPAEIPSQPAEAAVSAASESPAEEYASVVAEAIASEMVAADATGSQEIPRAGWESPALEASTGDAVGQVVEAVAEEAVPAETCVPEPAYAAAAAVGTEFHSISHVEAPPEEPPQPAPSQPPTAPAEANREHEAELAAAWAHWRQIRESIASPQFTQQVADVAAAGYKEIHPPASPQSPDPPPADEQATETMSADPAAIASIVDSVLAELKPKLVAEIARKLGKEKK